MNKKTVEILKQIGGFAILILAVFLSTVVGYYVYDWLLDLFDKNPGPFADHILRGMLDVFILFLSITVVSLFTRSKIIAVNRELMEAMKRIAKGDFNIKLNAPSRNGGPYREIVDGINHIAVELSQIETMRQEFISNVSHEIQTPLTSISGFAKALQSSELSGEQRRRYLGIIETESRRLSRMSDNLLRLSSLDSDRHPFTAKTYRLDKQVGGLILACEPQWLDKGISMEAELDETEITADEDLLSQVWLNLLQNSVKFTPEGGAILVQVVRTNDKAIFRISDTGSGIKAADLPRIFERFYKADKSRNRESGGNGLGLSMVHKIIEMHQGTITVESDPGIRTTFSVTIPSK